MDCGSILDMIVMTNQSTIKNKRTQTPCILKSHGFLQGFDHDVGGWYQTWGWISKILPTDPPGRYQKDVSLTVSVLEFLSNCRGWKGECLGAHLPRGPCGQNHWLGMRFFCHTLALKNLRLWFSIRHWNFDLSQTLGFLRDASQQSVRVYLCWYTCVVYQSKFWCMFFLTPKEQWWKPFSHLFSQRLRLGVAEHKTPKEVRRVPSNLDPHLDWGQLDSQPDGPHVSPRHWLPLVASPCCCKHFACTNLSKQTPTHYRSMNPSSS